MTRVAFLLPAEEEMTEAARFYESRAENLGAIFLSRVEKAIQEISENPMACPVIRAEIRRKLVVRFPYGVLYRIDPDEIVIIGIMHLRRRPNY